MCLYVMRSFFFSFRSYRDGKIGIFRSLSLEKMGFRQTLQCYCSTVIHCPNDMRYKSKLKSNSPNARKGCKTTAKKRFMGLIHKNIHLYIQLMLVYHNSPFHINIWLFSLEKRSHSFCTEPFRICF